MLDAQINSGDHYMRADFPELPLIPFSVTCVSWCIRLGKSLKLLEVFGLASWPCTNPERLKAIEDFCSLSFLIVETV